MLLLNTVLTVRRGQANSHRGKGWERFTDRVIECLNEREKPVVFILWGRNAQAKLEMIDTGRHLVIQSAHPSPYSAHAGFFGAAPFPGPTSFSGGSESRRSTGRSRRSRSPAGRRRAGGALALRDQAPASVTRFFTRVEGVAAHSWNPIDHKRFRNVV